MRQPRFPIGNPAPPNAQLPLHDGWEPFVNESRLLDETANIADKRTKGHPMGNATILFHTALGLGMLLSASVLTLL